MPTSTSILVQAWRLKAFIETVHDDIEAEITKHVLLVLKAQ